MSRLWMVDEVFCRFVVSSCRFSCFLCVTSRDEFSLCLLYCITYILLVLNKVFKWCSTWLYILRAYFVSICKMSAMDTRVCSCMNTLQDTYTFF